MSVLDERDRPAGHWLKGIKLKIDSLLEFVGTLTPYINMSGDRSSIIIKDNDTIAHKVEELTSGNSVYEIDTANKIFKLDPLYSSTGFTSTEVLATDTIAGIVEKSTSAENVAGVATDVYPDVAGVKEMIDTHGGGGSTTQAGSEPLANFTGTPKKATVALPVAYADTDYVPMIIGQGSDVYNITVESIAVGSFVINLNSDTAPTSNILWTTTKF